MDTFKKKLFLLFFIILIFNLNGTEDQADKKGMIETELESTFRPFLNDYCVDCHGPKKQKGKLRLDNMSFDLSSHFDQWADVVDELTNSNMPPEKAKKHPDADVTNEILSLLKEALKTAQESGLVSKNKVQLRRMNKVQYLRTIQDLFDINTEFNDVATAFPGDQEDQGFDNIGSALLMSKPQLKGYIDASERVVKAFQEQKKSTKEIFIKMGFTKSKKKPTPSSFPSAKSKQNGGPDILKFKNTQVDYREYISTEWGARFGVVYEDHVTLPFVGWRQDKALILKRGKLPSSGYYEITVDVLAMHRVSNYLPEKRKFKGTFLHKPMRLGLYLDKAVKQFKSEGVSVLIKSFDLPDSKRHSITHKVFVPTGWQVAFRWLNGPTHNPNHFFYGWNTKYQHPNIDEEEWKMINGLPQLQAAQRVLPFVLRDKKIPQIRFYNASIKGPVIKNDSKLKDVIFNTKLTNREKIKHFAKLAFRRPVTDEELLQSQLVELAGDTEEDLMLAIKAILCSPQFIYFYENEGKLNAHALASRLSYFLWNSMPDKQLFDMAEKNVLEDEQALTNQVDRMLNDSKSERFVKDFLWHWLGLNTIRTTPPDTKAFKKYYSYKLENKMLKETQLFFQHLIVNNLPVSNLIDSDFVFIDDVLADMYQIPDVTGPEFRKVHLKEMKYRGGLLGQMSMLTASADGISTSPVKRGTWVLDNLLGTPAPPPPADIEIPEPDSREAETVKEILAKHRSDENCASCHVKMDPLGFALENYDPIGIWRDFYDGRLKGQQKKGTRKRTPENKTDIIDSTGQTDSGEVFEDIVELKRILLKKEHLVARNLIMRLLTFGTGRTLSAADKLEIDQLVDKAKQKDFRLRDLIKIVVSSKIFLEK